MTDTSILWRRTDLPGHEAARILERPAGWRLVGTAVFEHDGKACRLDYRVACDTEWRTVSTRVSGWIGDDAIEIEIAADESGRWTLDGEEQPQVEGCVDVDLNFSPSTNTLPIRRLNLAVGDAVPVRAAWLRFPEFRLELLEQVYRRTGEDTYRYESAGGSFAADLRANPAGLVVEYAVWKSET